MWMPLEREKAAADNPRLVADSQPEGNCGAGKRHPPRPPIAYVFLFVSHQEAPTASRGRQTATGQFWDGRMT